MKTTVNSIVAALSFFGGSGAWAEDKPYVTLRSLTAPLAIQLAHAWDAGEDFLRTQPYKLRECRWRRPGFIVRACRSSPCL